MQIIRISLIVLFIVYGIILLILCGKSGKFFKALLMSSGMGLALYIILNFTAPLIGFSLPLNWYNTGVSAVLGIPGVISLLILNLFF